MFVFYYNLKCNQLLDVLEHIQHNFEGMLARGMNVEDEIRVEKISEITEHVRRSMVSCNNLLEEISVIS